MNDAQHAHAAVSALFMLALHSRAAIAQCCYDLIMQLQESWGVWRRECDGN
jgi:hypothetical protein